MEEVRWRYVVYLKPSGEKGVHVVIDSHGHYNATFLEYALFLMPCMPSSHELRGFETTSELVEYLAENPIGVMGEYINLVYLESGERRFREAVERIADGAGSFEVV